MKYRVRKPVGAIASFIVCSIWLFASMNALAGQPHLVLDINPKTVTREDPRGFTIATSKWSYFWADNGTHYEPWVTDGTGAGTFSWGAKSQLNLGAPRLQMGGKVYLAAPTVSGGAVVWVSDGTRTGSHIVGELTSDPTWVNFSPETAFGSQLVFTGMSQKTAARELWTLNGLGDPGAHISSSTGEPYEAESGTVTVVNGKLYFLVLAAAPGVGVEPWVSDGTSSGTKRLAYIPNAAGALITQLVQVGNYLIFAAATSTTGKELWRIDTRDNSVSQVADIAPGAASALGEVVRFGLVGAAAVFRASSDGSTFALWRTDGTAAGTYQIAPVEPDPNSATEFFGTASMGHLIFWAPTDSGPDDAWTTDGSSAGTMRLPISGASDTSLTLIGTHYYLAGSGNIWRTDGTAVGTMMLPGISYPLSLPEVVGDDSKLFIRILDPDAVHGNLYLYDLAAQTSTHLLTYPWNAPASGGVYGYAQGLLYFDNEDPTNGHEVWTSDGSVSGTHILKNITPDSPTATKGSEPSDFVGFNGLLYFAANDGNENRQLWKSDGSSVGTREFANLAGGALDSNPTDLFVAAGHLYFFAIDGSGAYELWNTDGTSAGTAALGAVSPRPVPFRLPGCDSKGVAVGSSIFFAGYDAASGVQLWKTDGTASGTQRVSNVSGASQNSFAVCYLTAFAGHIYFSGGDASNGFGRELWTSDGTATGTVRVTDVNPGALSSTPEFLQVFAGRIYFGADDGSHGVQLWSSDGSAAGTRLQTLLGKDPLSSIVGSTRNKLIVTTSDGTAAELWATDGSESGSMMLVPALTGGTAFMAHGATYLGGGTGNGPTSAAQLWVSDSTASGTVNVFQLPGASIVPSSWGDFNGITMFQTADQSIMGALWRTDGSAAGTLSTGAVALSNEGVTVGQNYFFVSDDGTSGAELWAITNNPPSVPKVDLGSVVSGQTITGNLLTNATDSDGRIVPATLTIVDQPQFGTVTVGSNGAITYTANPGFSQADSFLADTFAYTVADNQGATVSGYVTVSVTAAPGSTGSGSATPSSGGGGGGGGLAFIDLLWLLSVAALKNKTR
jgi:ELWxxDGT repeat protein